MREASKLLLLRWTARLGTIAVGAFSVCLVVLLAGTACAQRRQRDDDVIIKKVQVNRYIPVPPNEGHLTLFTTPQAEVGIRPLFRAAAPELSGQADEQGIQVFSKLVPGDYELSIAREDYRSIKAKINIVKGRAIAYSGILKPIYGTIVLAMADQAGPDVSVWLNEERIDDPARLEIKDGKIFIRRVRVEEAAPEAPERVTPARGTARQPVMVSAVELRVSKPNHETRTLQRIIQPGECDNLIALKLVPLTIELTVVSEPGAEVYLNSQSRGRVQPDRRLLISGLMPGEYRLRVEAESFEPMARTLFLRAEKKVVVEDASLSPLAEDGEFSEDFRANNRQWSVYWPDGWEPRTAPQRGVLVRGNAISLAFNTSRQGRRFNIYRDFRMILSLRPINGKGVSWVMRAKDERNYYLFELTTPRSDTGIKEVRFVVFRDGVAVRDEGHPLLASIEDAESPIRLQVEALGSRFRFTVLGQGPQGVGPEIIDSTFPLGGVGLRAIHGLEMFATEVYIQPLK